MPRAEARKVTAIYTVSVGSYGASYPAEIRFKVKEGEKWQDAMNKAGYKKQKKGYEWDIADAVVFLYDGWPEHVEGF